MKRKCIVECNSCKKSYYYESTGNPWPGGKEREIAYCPYCNAQDPSEVISGFINIYKIGDDGKPIKKEHNL